MFGPVIHSYTRAQAIADGFQVNTDTLTPGMAREAGFRYPVFLTSAVYEAYIRVPEGVEAQDEAGRLWDILWMTKFFIGRAQPGQDRINVELYVRNDNSGMPPLVKLVATCGPLDNDDPQPAITVMLPNED